MLFILKNVHNKKQINTVLSRKGKEQFMWVRKVAAMD